MFEWTPAEKDEYPCWDLVINTTEKKLKRTIFACGNISMVPEIKYYIHKKKMLERCKGPEMIIEWQCT